ncbi:hypothetical protein OHT76_05495 [Streptomyces sp. NBC_00287]|uniref:hypothetical protein n=1 Tax=Streptomyces sp. NBC_00287 TaxID=2975702 RepID=UPI002E2843AF|nr:hypothetical protein [Streptomyces sp. NBC_00287]
MPPAEIPDDGGPGGVAGWIAKGVTAAITGFFKSVINFALNPLLDLISGTVLTTPSPASLPRVGELWANSWEIALAGYGLLVALGGIVVMSHETVQTRYSIKEIAPRIPVAFLAAALSLFITSKAVDLANALSHAVMGGGVNASTAGPALRDFVLSSFSSASGNLFAVLMWLVVIVVLVALLLTYVVRVALTILLIVAAPLALVCHALPQTDGVARWWWKAFGGVLAIQIAQSLALITGVRVFLTPGGFGPNGLFGLTENGLVSVLITLALLYVVFKIPFWVLGSIRFSHGRSFVGSVVRGYVMYKTFGLLRGVGARGAASRGGRRPPPSGGPSGTRRSPYPGPQPSSGGAGGRHSGRQGGPAPTVAGTIGSGTRRPTRTPRVASHTTPTSSTSTTSGSSSPAQPTISTSRRTQGISSGATPATPSIQASQSRPSVGKAQGNNPSSAPVGGSKGRTHPQPPTAQPHAFRNPAQRPAIGSPRSAQPLPGTTPTRQPHPGPPPSIPHKTRVTRPPLPPPRRQSGTRPGGDSP